MKASKKRFTVVTSVLLTSAMLLSACGGGKEAASPSASTAPSESSAATQAPATGKPVNLIWYTVGAPQKDTDKVFAEVNKYTAEKIGVTVTMKQIDYGDYTQKMQVNVASGEPMDILFTCSWAFDYVQNARKGAFMELDKLIEEHGKELKAAIDPAFLEGSKVNGHNYAIPANKELPAQEVWRFKKDLVDKYKIDITKATTLESLEPMLKTIKENEPNVIPYTIVRDHMPLIPYDYVIQSNPLAVKMDTKDYKVVNILETPEMKAALTTMHKYYKAGYIQAEAANTSSNDDVMKAGSWFVDRASTQPFADNIWSLSQGYPIISTPASKAIIYNWSVMGSMQAISANSEHPVEAMKFLNLLNSDPYLRNMVDSGIEGVHYEKVSENVMKNLPAATDYDVPTFAMGNIMLNYLYEADPANKWEEFKKFNESGVPSPLLGFNFDTTNVTNELASMQNAKEEFWAALMTGTVDPEEYLPKAIEKLKAAGLDKLMAEAQSQIDAWKVANNK